MTREGAAWRIIALWVGPLALAQSMLLPGLTLAGRLVHPTGWGDNIDATALAILACLAFGTAWLSMLGVYHLILVPNGRDRQSFWRFWLPALYGLGGQVAALLGMIVVAGIDRPEAPSLGALAPMDYPVGVGGLLLAGGAGQFLGRLAGETDRLHGRRPASRALWITEVHPDPMWWTMQAAGAVALSVMVFGPFAATWGGTAAVASGLSLVTGQLVMTLTSSRVTLILTADGIFVRRGYVGSRRTLLTMAGIESVEVAQANLPRLLLSCLLPHRWSSEQGQLLLRNGPAVAVRTRWGERRWFT
ncbi:MAG: hypothetical protein J2P28_21905, partial [Actinobacteria bacterium]|nr:hypothetical protein [Actinomycetota bacterium]